MTDKKGDLRAVANHDRLETFHKALKFGPIRSLLVGEHLLAFDIKPESARRKNRCDDITLLPFTEAETLRNIRGQLKQTPIDRLTDRFPWNPGP